MGCEMCNCHFKSAARGGVTRVTDDKIGGTQLE